MLSRCALTISVIAAALLVATRGTSACSQTCSPLDPIFDAHQIVILGDVKHGVRARIGFFSSETLFASMARAGVKHVAIEMPRVLGRQALGVETEADVAAFAQDVVNSGRWHFVDPDHADEQQETTQRVVASAMARQVLLARRYGINPIFYDFNNPLGGFRTMNDPVYRCLATLTPTTWVKYGLDQKITKGERDAAIMRERFSHDDELAQYIETEVTSHGGGKLVVIPGFAHAVLPEGLANKLAGRLSQPPAVVAVFADGAEEQAFPAFLMEQAHLLKVNLSRSPDYAFRIAENTVSAVPVRNLAGLDGTETNMVPPVCYQIATMQ